MTAPTCPSRFASVTETGAAYWPSCDREPGHEGPHRHGHFQDVMWSWSDEDALTGDER